MGRYRYLITLVGVFSGLFSWGRIFLRSIGRGSCSRSTRSEGWPRRLTCSRRPAQKVCRLSGYYTNRYTNRYTNPSETPLNTRKHHRRENSSDKPFR